MASLSFFSTTQTSPLLHPRKPHHPSSSSYITPPRRFHTSCNNTSSNHNTTSSNHDTANATNTTDTPTKRRVPGSGSGSGSGSPLRLDRRNVLLGLGGLYGATSLTGQHNVALGEPVGPPDLSHCHPADSGSICIGEGKVDCCPPYSADTPIHEWTFPDASKPTRVRRPAHLLLQDEIDKYKRAVAKLRELTENDPNDPRGWMQQANIHCQNCSGAYYQAGYEESHVPLQIHFCWYFLPWHRWYLHFYERILGSLIDDDSFALPYWNWDHPDGMYMPNVFVHGRSSSSLYDDNRTHSHYPPAVLDFKYSYCYPDCVPATPDEEQVKDQNLYEIHRLYRESLAVPELFMGDPKRAGERPEEHIENSSSGLEMIHNTVHNWTGKETKPYIDMGLFSTAAQDPIFFSHHSNLDRMWHIYRQKRHHEIEFDDNDWLDGSFLFVDENRNLVKVKVRDSLDPHKLKYTYECTERPWEDMGVQKRLLKYKAKPGTSPPVKVSEFGSTPRLLLATIGVLVTRPTRTQNDNAVEALIIHGIQAPISDPSRFDVYVTTQSKYDLDALAPSQLTASFVMLPHHSSQKEFTLKLGITALLEDLDAAGEKNLVVSLVPRMGVVTVGGVRIDLLQRS